MPLILSYMHIFRFDKISVTTWNNESRILDQVIVHVYYDLSPLTLELVALKKHLQTKTRWGHFNLLHNQDVDNTHSGGVRVSIK